MYVGVTIIVATADAVPVLIAVNDGMLSAFPLDNNPIFGLLLVQEYVVVPGVLIVVNAIAAVALPLHNTCEAGWLTCADGFTVIV